MPIRQLDEESIFHLARKIHDEDARREYLDQICAGDPPLRARVEALLNVNDQDQQFLKSAPRPEPTVDCLPTYSGQLTSTSDGQLPP